MSARKRVLCLICDGFEELEMIAPVDLLRRAGVEVVIAALDQLVVAGRNGIRLTADALLHEVLSDDYDLLLLPGGPGVAKMRADGRAAQMARRMVEEGKMVAAICAAPLVLHDAGLLAGRNFTCFPAVKSELIQALDESVVQDGPLITSRGAGTAMPFALAIVARLCGEGKAVELKREIAC